MAVDHGQIGLGFWPSELLLELAGHFMTARDINSMSKVNRRFYQVFDTYLYQFEIANDLGRVLPWAVEKQNVGTLAKALHLKPVAHSINQKYIMGSENTTTLIYRAVQNNSEDMVKMLLDAGAQHDTDDEHALQPLYKATQLNHIPIIKLLAGNENFMTPQAGVLAMGTAARLGNDILFCMLMDYFRFRHQHTAELRAWFEYGAFDSVTASPTAYTAATVRMMEYLFLIDPEEKWRSFEGHFLTNIAHSSGDNLELFEFLVDLGLSPRCSFREDGHWPVCHAMMFGNFKIAKYLLSEGHVSMDCINSGCLLTKACSGYGEATVTLASMILQLGANINTRHEQLSPLFCACYHGNSMVFGFLLANGVDVTRSLMSRYPLHVVCERRPVRGAGFVPIARWLLELGYDHMAPDELDDTPLHRACEVNNLEAIQLLLQHGADPTIVSRVVPYGTCFDRAWECQHIEAVDMILSSSHRSTIVFPREDFKPRGHLHTVDMAMRLKRDGVPISLTPYFLNAARVGNLEIVQTLVDLASFPQYLLNEVFEFENPLLAAIKGGHHAVAYKCLQLGFPLRDARNDHDPSRCSGMFRTACQNGDITMVEMLIRWQTVPSRDLIRGFRGTIERGQIRTLKTILHSFYVDVYQTTCKKQSFFTLAQNARQTLAMEALSDYAANVKDHAAKPLFSLDMLPEHVCRSCSSRASRSLGPIVHSNS